MTSTAVTSNATKIGNGVDLWKSTDNRFNGTVYADLKSKLFGTDSSGNPVDPATYIKNTATSENITEFNLTGSYVVPASTINSKISGSNKNYGYIVKLGGLDWMVASMTLSRTNQPVITLYLAESSGTSIFYNYGTAKADTKGHNMYSSSALRTNLLASSTYSLFARGSFATQYLVQPNNIAYQHTESAVGRMTDMTSWNYTCTNEALDTQTSGWHTDLKNPYTAGYSFNGTSGGGTNATYEAWGADYIWIPSLTEIGGDNAANTTCIWKLSSQQRQFYNGTSTTQADCCWSRTGYFMRYETMAIFRPTGDVNGGGVTTTMKIRPAIHLNIAAIENSVTLSEPKAPTDPYIYDGTNRDLKGESWYNNNKTIIDNASLCTVTYADEDGVTVTPKDAGTYKATFTLNGTDYFWAGTDKSKTRTVTFKIEPKTLDVSFVKDSDTGLPKLSLTNTAQLCGTDTVNCVIRYYDKNTEDKKDLGTDLSKLSGNTQYYAYAEFDKKNYVPNNPPVISFINPATPVSVGWVDDEKSQDYTGDWLGFYLQDYDSDIIEVSYDDENNFDGNTEFLEKDAGKYTVNLKIKDDKKQDYCWGPEMGDAAGTTDDTTIEFEIKPAVRKLEVASIDPADWTVHLGGTCNVELDPQPLIKGTGSVEVMIWAKRTQNANPIELCRVTLTEQADPITCQFVTTGIRIKGTYIIGAQVADKDSAAAKNYSIVFDDNYTLTVEEAVQTSGIIWRLYSGNSSAGSLVDESGATSTTWNKTVTYNGKAYSFTVNPSGLGLTVDTSFGTKGYKTVKAGTSKNLGAVTDAGDYVTTVKLSNGAEYSIEWTIEKAKFDLSGVRWIENGNITYAAGGVTVTLDPSTIPSGLAPNYGGTRSANNAGDSGRAEVTFTVADPDNYETPDALVAGSYTFTPNGGLTDFEWGKDWTMSAMQIPVNWTVGTISTQDNKKINAEVLAGGFGDYIKYLYYETDASGNKLDPSAAGRDEPEITDNVIRYYIAEAQINPAYGTNCVFASSTNLISPVFEVGRVLTAVQVEAKKSEYTYWGSPVTFLYNVKGAISSSAFEVTYYKGLTRLNGAPTDPGQYRAQLSLKSAYTTSYYLDGTASFDFTIVHAMITVNWNESVKPPVLNLTQDQAQYITYEYRDSTGKTVSFANLSTGVYDVIAKITDTSRYQFTGELAANETFTDWFEFEIKANDKVTDPSNSLPPFTPSTDPNGDGSGTTSGKTPIWIRPTYDKVNGLQIENQFGWDNNAFTITYILDGKVVPNCNAAGNYTVEISLDSNSYVIDNASQTILHFTVETGDASGGTTTTPDVDGGKDDGTGNNPSDATIVSYLPLILSGVSLVLIVVFLIMTLNNLSAAKEAREKTKKLAMMSYSVSPMGLLAIVLGLAESNWWIIAGVLMGLALLMAIVAFMSKGKKKKALLALEEEQNRIAEEKEYARQDEQQRRDNELKMMFASMQQNYQQPQVVQPQLQMDDIRGLLAETVSALLPTLQQQMALPPASFDVNASISAEAQKEIDGLHEQIAQQQELLNQILQNQQSYMTYEEEVQDDTSWLGESDEMISLEESYGALSDEGRRFYYEVGSYIMNKPKTSQNDGRYAVLFKYRGRTIFKLAIKDDAPVLYYPAGGGRSEIRVSDASSLELAKSAIDRQTIKVDSEL
ncbi:MAG: hypothetical protein K2L02_01545 [Clostridia bacterium]|nr:hypothetical protein [Clostridia bacterium]